MSEQKHINSKKMQELNCQFTEVIFSFKKIKSSSRLNKPLLGFAIIITDR